MHSLYRSSLLIFFFWWSDRHLKKPCAFRRTAAGSLEAWAFRREPEAPPLRSTAAAADAAAAADEAAADAVEEAATAPETATERDVWCYCCTQFPHRNETKTTTTAAVAAVAAAVAAAAAAATAAYASERMHAGLVAGVEFACLLSIHQKQP